MKVGSLQNTGIQTAPPLPGVGVGLCSRQLTAWRSHIPHYTGGVGVGR